MFGSIFFGNYIIFLYMITSLKMRYRACLVGRFGLGKRAFFNENTDYKLFSYVIYKAMRFYKTQKKRVINSQYQSTFFKTQI